MEKRINKNRERFEIRLMNGRIVKVKGHRCRLPFGYEGVIHRPYGSKDHHWVLTELFTGAEIICSLTPLESRIDLYEKTVELICQWGLAYFEEGFKEILIDGGCDDLNSPI